MIDSEGYRANVGILITNDKNQVLLAKRYKQDSWQLPQGGIDQGESDVEALLRELNEEIGLESKHVSVIAKTPKWLRYDLPDCHVRRSQKPLCVGQKQVWFLMRMLAEDGQISLDHSPSPEFDRWQWVDYWLPPKKVVSFKRTVYEKALSELEPML